jgi:hypothetical protein
MVAAHKTSQRNDFASPLSSSAGLSSTRTHATYKHCSSRPARAEFMPYVFQIMSQLLELHDPPAPPAYQELFPHLLAPPLWEKLGVCAMALLASVGSDLIAAAFFSFGQASRAVTT